MAPKIVLYLSEKADDATRQNFCKAVEQLDLLLKAGMINPTSADEETRVVIGAVEIQDKPDNVVTIAVYMAEHVSFCRMFAKLLMERHGVGDKCRILENPHRV